LKKSNTFTAKIMDFEGSLHSGREHFKKFWKNITQALVFEASNFSTITRLNLVDRELFITHLNTGYCFTFITFKE
jgi:hypothetical protein